MAKIKGDHIKIKEVEKKTKGDHLKPNEVKMNILEFILKNTGPVSESSIREHLKNKYGICDPSTINKHMNKLKDLRCIKLTSLKASRINYWDIIIFSHLKNIRHEFPELQLNKHEKSINLLLSELQQIFFSFELLKFYTKLRMSVSLFNACIEPGIETLYKGAWRVYINNKESHQYQLINNLLKLCYRTCVKYYPDFKMSKKAFMDTMKELPWKIDPISPEEHVSEYIENYLPGLPEGIKYSLFTTRPNYEIKTALDVIPDEIDKKDLVTYLTNTLLLIMWKKLIFLSDRENILLEHFLNHDMLMGIDSQEELEIAEKTKDQIALLRESVDLSQFLSQLSHKICQDVILNRQ